MKTLNTLVTATVIYGNSDSFSLKTINSIRGFFTTDVGEYMINVGILGLISGTIVIPDVSLSSQLSVEGAYGSSLSKYTDKLSKGKLQFGAHS